MTLEGLRLPLSLEPLIAEAKRRARQRRVLIALGILLLAGLAGGLALAFRSPGSGGGVTGGLGAFNRLAAAQHARAGASVLPPAILSAVEHGNAEAAKPGTHLFQERLDTARLLAKTPAATVYVLADSRGYLCSYEVVAPPVFTGNPCAPPLNKATPITFSAGNECTATTGCNFTAGGIAVDGVRSVSFTVRGKRVTVPVEHNVYALKRPISAEAGAASSAPTGQCAAAHFADGSTVKLTPYPPCPSGR
jgi:hypothetical protein